MNRKEYLKKWREEHKEHIKQYKKDYAKNHDSSFKKLQKSKQELLNQQEKFIEYLENVINISMIGACDMNTTNNIAECKSNYQEILQKYKEIIGGK